MDSNRPRILVLGIGNPLAGDEGIGIHVIERIQKQELPPNVRVVDGGTGGIDLVQFLEECDCAVVVDAADMKAPPGTCRVFSLDEVDAMGRSSTMSLHQADFPSVVRLTRMLTRCPDVIRVVGIQPEVLRWQTTLGPMLTSKFDEIVDRVLAEVESCQHMTPLVAQAT
ncbi:MAG: hydrogenase maturation protease [Planctomycetes bacterium]|nr:hydrogenase maturation protease [Planctomycetota bacterium]